MTTAELIAEAEDWLRRNGDCSGSVLLVSQNLITRLTQALRESEAEAAVMREKARAVIDRWETPLWKDVPHTGNFIYDLRDTLTSTTAGSELLAEVERLRHRISSLEK